VRERALVLEGRHQFAGGKLVVQRRVTAPVWLGASSTLPAVLDRCCAGVERQTTARTSDFDPRQVGLAGTAHVVRADRARAPAQQAP